MPPKPIPPGPGQESVWDYPRPPRLERVADRIRILFAGAVLADTTAAWRVLETSHPPTWYLPRSDVAPDALQPSALRSTWCEWKGAATYWDVASTPAGSGAAWSYEHPSPGYEAITGHLAFSPRLLECSVDGEAVVPQPGDFYAGWITADVVGPFKGIPGSRFW